MIREDVLKASVFDAIPGTGSCSDFADKIQALRDRNMSLDGLQIDLDGWKNYIASARGLDAADGDRYVLIMLNPAGT